MSKLVALTMMLLWICILVSSCTLDTWSQEKQANNILDILICALEDNDSNTIKQLFSQRAQTETTNLEEQIDDMLEYFDGEVISYDRIRTAGGEEKIRDGEVIYSSIGNAKSERVVTSECTYTISFAAIIVDGNERNEGIWRLWIGKNEDDYMIVGLKNGYATLL